MEISNTLQLITVLRKSFSRHRLARIIGCSPLSILRWEDGVCNASERYVPGFNKAIHRAAQAWSQFPEVRDCIAQNVRVRVR